MAQHAPAFEEAHEDVITNQKAEHGATPGATYKGTRFFDEDIGEGAYCRIWADRFLWVGKRAGGWQRGPRGGQGSHRRVQPRGVIHQWRALNHDCRGSTGTWRGHRGV